MNNYLKMLLLGLGTAPFALSAQTVDTTKYTDFSPYIGEPDPSLLVYGSANQGKSLKAADVSQRPDHVNNMESRCFPPVFNQAGGSCGSASRIGYMFTHEMNAYRNADGSLAENWYPTHFVWLFTKGNSGKEAFMSEVGIPNAVAYGGRTYSSLFGNQSDGDEAFGWMNGYDKWYSGMFNRMGNIAHIPANLGTKEGREAMKNWLWNHNGDADYACGGLGGIGVATGTLSVIPSTPTNDEIGLTGLKCVGHWGDQVNHALTLVGYDDRVEFDLDGDGIYGEQDADERGAWIIVNSWGTKWANGGAVYCPYAYGGKRFNMNKDGSYTFDPSTWWVVEVLGVRKDYRPLRTIKLRMDYSHRSEMALSAGIAADVNADKPERVQKFHHFQYAGDGERGNKNPAPAVPMLGRWADGKLHDEPMEFGYDLTDLTEGYDRSQPLKYFFIINTREWGIGTGHIYDAAIIDYEFDKNGVEFPFDMQGDNVEIRSQGAQTIITVVVRGEGYSAPHNVILKNNLLTWETPQNNMYEVAGYKIFKNRQLMAEVGADVLQYTLETDDKVATYGVVAVYKEEVESAPKEVMAAVAKADTNAVLELNQGGFIVPDVFSAKHDCATVEFWVSPKSRENGIFEIELRKSDFFIVGDDKGKVSMGWDDEKTSKFVTSSSVLPLNNWTHIAVVVNHDKASLYVNGRLYGSAVSKTHVGVGNLDDLFFHKGKNVSRINARFDEIRIWDVAKTPTDILNNCRVEYVGKTYPAGLMAYYKGDVVSEHYKDYVFDCVGGHHALLEGEYQMAAADVSLKFVAPKEPVKVEFIAPQTAIHVGETVELHADYSNSVTSLKWNIPALGIQALEVVSPKVSFNKVGNYEVEVMAENAAGEIVKANATLEVLATPAASADFSLSKSQVAMGERVSFHVNAPVPGYRYEWNLPGAEVEKLVAVNASAVYDKIGAHNVTLYVLAADGKKIESSKQIEVLEVAPMADFDLSAAVIEKGNAIFLKDLSKYNPTSWQWMLSSEKKNILIDGQHTSLTLETPGVYDVTLTAANNMGKSVKSRKGALVVCNADSKTGLNFAQSAAKVVLTQVPISANSRAFTIDWWMNPDRISTYCNGMGEGEQSFLLKNSGDGIMSLVLGGKETLSGRKFVIPYEWHHYAVTFDFGKICFYRDGVQVSSAQNATKMVPAMKQFSIGLEHMNMSGMIDEFRIWEDCLTEKEIQQYANAPIEDVKKAEDEHNLVVYYDFNQGSGDASDATSHQNTGVRRGFGPDGDAWSLSSGVFCLNFEATQMKEISDAFLKNYKAPFKYDGNKLTNATGGNCHAIADWTLENTKTENGNTAGIYVDSNKRDLFTCQVGWQNFPNLENHKAFQTMTLPAGTYEFVANYGYHKSAVKNVMLVAAAGKTLPDVKACSKQALAAVEMLPRSTDVMSNKIKFVLQEETEVSLGLVMSLSGKQCFILNDFQLKTCPFEQMEADGAMGYDLSVDASGYNTLYLPYAVTIPEGVTAYVVSKIEGGSVTLTAVNDGVIPAHTGVVIVAKAGNYRFAPTSSTGKVTSLLKGSYHEFTPDSGIRYYMLDTEATPCFKLYQGEIVPANRAYFTTDQSNAVETYTLNFVTTGINNVLDAEGEAKTYDTVGRQATQPKIGVYISNGKKILVK